MKKFLAIICALALLATMTTACKKKNKDKPEDTDVTGEAQVESNETTEAPARETIDLDGDGISDGYVIEGVQGFDEEEVHDNPNEGQIVDSGTIQTTVIAEGGKEEGLWPTEDIPEDVPAFEEYEEMYPAQKEESDTATNWYLGFDATEEEYEAWLDQLRKEGYTESDKIVGFWGNGEQIINVSTEMDGDIFCVNIDIFKSEPVQYPDAVKNNFPIFTPSDSTLYGWYLSDEGDLLNVGYACGASFEADLTAYKQALTDAGFTVSESEATKTVDGKTYVVRYGDEVSRYEDALEYIF